MVLNELLDTVRMFAFANYNVAPAPCMDSNNLLVAMFNPRDTLKMCYEDMKNSLAAPKRFILAEKKFLREYFS
jgi:hypothetical protein